MKVQNFIEAEGTTIEKAVQKGLQKLGLPRHKVKIKVLSEEKKGLFGMPGAKLAKVRVTVISSKENT